MPQCVVVDSQFVYDLFEAGCPVCDEIVFKSYVKAHPVRFTPTTGHELVDIAIEDVDEFTRTLLPNLRNSPVGLITLDPLNNDPEKIRVNTGIAHLAAEVIMERGALKNLPSNVAYILAETAVVNTHSPVFCLLLDESVLKQIDVRLLREIWAARELAPFPIVDRKTLLQKLQ